MKSPRRQPSILIGLIFLTAGFLFEIQGDIPRAHQFMGDYQGSVTCTECHSDATAEIMATVHWTWEHESELTGQILGKNNVVNNYCVAVPSNEPRCTSCHIGVGYSNKHFDFSDASLVDCLVCHDTTGTYKKFPTGSGHPVYDEPKEFPPGSGNLWQPPDLNFIAKNAGKTSRATCGACHFFGGGGDAVKHGDLDSSLLNPTRDIDVHMGVDGADFTCASCHQTDDHKIPGTRYASTKTDNQSCESCHSSSPHSSDRLDAHTSTVACQTCHIPTFARGGLATKMVWDWSKAGLKDANGKPYEVKDERGNPTYDSKKGEFVWEENVIPEYIWFDGMVTYLTLDDEINGLDRVVINRMNADIHTPKALIFPVKRFKGIQPFDAGTNRMAIPHLFGSDENAYWKGWDWNKALTAGMEYVGRSFSGELGFVETEMFWIQNHMVAPKEEALSCSQCHAPKGRLDFLALGYEPERAITLQNLYGPPSFRIVSIGKSNSGQGIILTWEALPGADYKIQVSRDLKAWMTVDSGDFTPSNDGSQISWSSEAPNGSHGFYRVALD